MTTMTMTTTTLLALTAFMLLSAGATLAEDKKEDKKAESGNVMAEMNKKLEELARQVADQKAENEELRTSHKADKKEIDNLQKKFEDLRQSEAQLRLSDKKEIDDFRKEVKDLRQSETQLRRLSDDAQRRQRDFAALTKTDDDDDDDDTKLRKVDAQLRKADAGVRRADADLREADLKTREEEAEKKELKQQSDDNDNDDDNEKMQKNFEDATRALIRATRQEIYKYDKALNGSQELKKVIRAEIREKMKNVKKRLKKVIRAKINGYFASIEFKKVIQAAINGSSGVRRLIAIGNGKAKWDGDAGGDTVENTVEEAFSTSAGTGGGGCAGWSASLKNYKRPFPIMVWYEFSSTHIPAGFSFRQISNNLGPKEWSFVGSKEEDCSHGSTWKTLCGGNKTPVKGDEVGCDVPNYLREPFKCLGISVDSTNYKFRNAVCLKAMQFWERLTSPA